MLEIKIDGLENIDDDYNAFTPRIEKAVKGSLNTMQSTLIKRLQAHIQEDVYDEYKPKDYIRRHDLPEYGMSIFDKHNMHPLPLTGRYGLEFSYTPDDGKNSFHKYAEEERPYYTTGDTIIDVIQNDSGYLWRNGGNIGKKRPFWNNFVDEVTDQADKWFAKGINETDMGGKGDKLRAVSDGKAERENKYYELHSNYSAVSTEY